MMLIYDTGKWKFAKIQGCIYLDNPFGELSQP
jgi:hypothetical protein